MKINNEVSPNMWDDYLSQHLKPTKRFGFYHVVKSLKVFKSVRHEYCGQKVIASLLIPVGATIFCPHVDKLRLKKLGSGKRIIRYGGNFKMRATRAKVVALARSEFGDSVSQAYSTYDLGFKYKVGDLVFPKRTSQRFHTYAVCASGIHFFLTVGEARGY